MVFGGVKYGGQMRALAPGIDVLVATPGRLLDHLGEKTITLEGVETFVLDEADQMLDMGFIVPIRKIVKFLPKAPRQNLFFSATWPTEIEKLAGEILNPDPLKVSVTPQATTVEKVNQRVVFVEQQRKRALLAELFDDAAFKRVIVFTRTKRGADRVARGLEQVGVDAASIHGDKSQGQRERALAEFKSGRAPVLVATDIAARGIDVDGVTHVIQHDLPDVPETYVHRIGRTARAGASGEAVALCCPEERSQLRAIERLIRQAIPAEDRRSDRSASLAEEPRAAKAPRGRGGQPRQAPRREGQPSRGDAPRQAAKRAEHPRGDRSHAENPRGDRARADHPRSDRPRAEHPRSDRPRAEHPRDEQRRAAPASPRPQQPPSRAAAAPGGHETRRRPQAAHAAPRRDRSWRDGDFRDGASVPAFLTRGR